MRKPHTREGMTLIELVIVLGLLAALATMSLGALDGLGERQRFDTTQARLEQIRHAVAGDGIQAGRFLSDMGRLPVIRDIGDGRALSELWEEPGEGSAVTLDLSTLAASLGVADFPAISVAPWFRWRGPYLDTVMNGLYDGYGSEFRLTDQSEPVESDWKVAAGLGEGALIVGVRSFGRNDAYDDEGNASNWVDEDAEIVFSTRLVETTLEVTVKVRDFAGDIWRSGAPDLSALPPRVQGYYSEGALISQIRESDGDLYVFECAAPGKTASSSQMTSTTANFTPGATTSDGTGSTIVWKCLGDISDMAPSDLYAILLIPDPVVDTGAGTLQYRIGYESHQAPDWGASVLLDGDSADLTVTSTDIDRLTPGVRKFFAFAYLQNQTASTVRSRIWASASVPQTIELKPGANYTTVYLTERLD